MRLLQIILRRKLVVFAILILAVFASAAMVITKASPSRIQFVEYEYNNRYKILSKNFPWKEVKKEKKDEAVWRYQHGSKWGLARVSGLRMTEPVFDYIDAVAHDGVFLAQIGGRWGYVDSLGKWVVDPRFCIAGKFSNGLAAVQDSESRKYGYINLSGKYVFPPQFDYAEDFDDKGMANVYNMNWIDIIRRKFSDVGGVSNKKTISANGKLIK